MNNDISTERPVFPIEGVHERGALVKDWPLCPVGGGTSLGLAGGPLAPHKPRNPQMIPDPSSSITLSDPAAQSSQTHHGP
ncbi:hypothetical protein JZ751_002339 [Albula glossodonta]|uniref:Uncharacterized protein n=1 Tax=Albula glossodonta TaxID=121402 RepID=A0A8T2PBK8_9TELE|nr:hypothetical protein JZ751_002339 [Albula glossodonta]